MRKAGRAWATTIESKVLIESIDCKAWRKQLTRGRYWLDWKTRRISNYDEDCLGLLDKEEQSAGYIEVCEALKSDLLCSSASYCHCAVVEIHRQA
jgi:hypothetical protein